MTTFVIGDTHWKTHPVHTDYAVSDDGRVKRITPGQGTWPGRILKASPGERGYPVVRLPGGKDKYVHVMVLETFIGPKPEGLETRHLNGDKTNARLDNLKWGTNAENHEDKKKHGHMLCGIAHHWNKLTLAQVEEVAAMKGKELQRNVAFQYGVGQQHVSRIWRGWRPKV